MEEDAKDHDFDKREDGPFRRPTVEIERDLPHRTTSNEMDKTRSMSLSDAMKSPSSPIANTPSSPTIASPKRHSTQKSSSQDPALISQQGRRSTQISRSGLPRESFDIRRDGPYGRQSLTMTRRKSSGVTLPTSPGGAQDAETTVAVASESKDDVPGDEQPPSIETLQSSDPAFEPEPPSLNYSLWPRKWYILIFWGLILIDCIAMPIGLYFGLWYGTNLTPNTVFSIVTAALGGISILEYVLRFRRLWRKGSTCRVIGARRSYLDFFHWNFSLGWVIIMVELIVGTIPKHPPIRLLAMPQASMLYAFGTELLIVDIMRYFQLPAPIRISSVPKGAQLRPGIYSIIEDVCAVDGSGGTDFREALNCRYEASHVFRSMLRRMGAFWAVGAEGMAVVLTILIFTIQHEAAYVVGWAVPWIWAGVWVGVTIWYVKRCLREEKKAWAEEIVAKTQV